MFYIILMTNAPLTSPHTASDPGAKGGLSPKAMAGVRETTLDDLARMQRVAMEMIEGLGRRVRGQALPHDVEAGLHRGDPILAFTRLFRTFHHVVVMQRQMTAAEGATAISLAPAPRGGGSLAQQNSGAANVRANLAPVSTAASVPVRRGKDAVKPSDAGQSNVLVTAPRVSPSPRAALLVGAAGVLPIAQGDMPPWRIPSSPSKPTPANGQGPPR